MSVNDGGLSIRRRIPMTVAIVAVLACLGAMIPSPVRADAGIGLVEGRLLSEKGRPVAGARLLFFLVDRGAPPSPATYWRVPDIVGISGDDGAFSTRLPAGRYMYGVVHFRKDGHPLLEDWLLLGRNPQGTLAELEVIAGETLSLGEISAFGVDASSGTVQQAIRLSGRILNRGGEPVAEVVVEFYPQGKTDWASPLFAADRSAADGWYSIDLPPGRYVLKARPSEPLGRGYRGFRPLAPAPLQHAGNQTWEEIEINEGGVHDLRLDIP